MRSGEVLLRTNGHSSGDRGDTLFVRESVLEQIARDETIWSGVSSHGADASGHPVSLLNRLREHCRSALLATLPESVRFGLKTWESQVRRLADATFAASLKRSYRNLELQKRRWYGTARGATRGEPGFLARLRCLRLAGRFETLSRKLERMRMLAASSERKAADDLEEAKRWAQRVELHYGVCLNSQGRNHLVKEQYGSGASVAGSASRFLLEESLAWVLERRTRVLQDRKVALAAQIEGLKSYLREVRSQVTTRQDIVVLMRNRYALNAKEWPSQATERALLTSLDSSRADLEPLQKELFARHRMLESQAAELRQHLRLTLERVSRFVVPPPPSHGVNSGSGVAGRLDSIDMRHRSSRREVEL